MSDRVGFTSAQEFFAFAFSGKAVFTVQNVASGNHFTFKLRQDKGNADTFWATQEGGESVFLGRVSRQMAQVGIATTFKSRAARIDMRPVGVFGAVFATLVNHGRIPAGVTIQHEGKCGVCSRRLTHPTSLQTGIGPECAGRLSCERLAA